MNVPEQDELVIAVVKKIMPYGAFCVLSEYENAEAFLHVSEIAPRWIKNIHEFVSEGERLVVKVYLIDQSKNQIDVSLKRVSEQEKRRKLELARTEKRGEMLLALAIKNSGSKITPEEATKAIEEKFDSVYACFEDSMENPADLEESSLPKPLIKQILEVAKKNLKKAEVEVSGIVNLTCYATDGLNTIKKLLSKLEDSGVVIQYLGAPNYKVLLKAKSYKEGEKLLVEKVDSLESVAQKLDCDFSFEKSKKQ
ncbi:MAG: S1 RNA-binding domain-containing protein [Candidatus Micrarchaeota archaeon]